MARLVVASDSHLSPSVPETGANWDAVVAHVERAQPDLVVHLGDLTLDGADDLQQLRGATAQLDRLAAPWRAVPGNHDLGENPAPGTDPAHLIDDARRDRWLSVMGEDRWSTRVDGWTLVGIDAQLLGSGLPAEEDQWAWLDHELAAADGPVALLTHKPVAGDDEELSIAPGHRFVLGPSRDRLAALAGWDRVRLVVSGHVHQHRDRTFAGARHVWAPTTWALLPIGATTPAEVRRCGVLELDLQPDGDVAVQLVEPEGLRQLTLGEDVPNPYGH